MPIVWSASNGFFAKRRFLFRRRRRRRRRYGRRGRPLVRRLFYGRVRCVEDSVGTANQPVASLPQKSSPETAERARKARPFVCRVESIIPSIVREARRTTHRTVGRRRLRYKKNNKRETKLRKIKGKRKFHAPKTGEEMESRKLRTRRHGVYVHRMTRKIKRRTRR